MNVVNFSSKRRQSGVFTLEMALVAGVMVVVLAFTTDVVLNQSIKGSLDRLSYSLVNVLKERTQFYSENETIDSAQIDELYSVLTESMGRTVGQFDSASVGMYVEQQRFDSAMVPIEPQTDVHIFTRGPLTCTSPTALRDLEALSVITTFDRRATLYMVTVCYRGHNWFGSLVGDEFDLVRSQSMMVGR